MATLNVSVTQSNVLLTSAVSSGSTLDFVIDNPIPYTSYFTLETVADNNGFYTNSTSKNTSGSFTLGTGQFGLIQSDYMASVVVPSGSTTLSFIPAVNIPASTLYLRGIGAGPYSTIATFDPDAQAFFDRVTTAGGSLTTTEQNAVNQLVVDMKSYGIWTSMKAVYPMVGASAAACAQNLKSSSFTGTFTSGWTFASTGVTPNGTSAYMDTFFIPSVNGMSNSNGHLSVYNRSNITGTNKGLIGTIGIITEIAINFDTNDIYAMFGTSPYPSFVQTDKRGFYSVSRDTSTTVKNYFNGSVKVNGTTVNYSDTPTGKILLGVQGSLAGGTRGNFSSNEQAFASIGDTLNSTQSANLYTAVQAFQTTLGRQV